MARVASTSHGAEGNQCLWLNREEGENRNMRSRDDVQPTHHWQHNGRREHHLQMQQENNDLDPTALIWKLHSFPDLWKSRSAFWDFLSETPFPLSLLPLPCPGMSHTCVTCSAQARGHWAPAVPSSHVPTVLLSNSWSIKLINLSLNEIALSINEAI